MDAFRDSVIGDYSIARCDAVGNMLCVNDNLGMEHIYYAEDRDFIYLSNRIRLIKVMLIDSAADIETLSWIALCGSVIGNGTSVKGVTRLPQGSWAAARGGERRNLEIHSNDLFMYRRKDQKKEFERHFDRYFQKNVQVCVNRVKAAVEKIGILDFPLTGGKDSRSLLALLLQSGYKDKITCYTMGYENHPDVVVAKKIAEHYHLPHRVQEHPKQSMTANQIVSKLMASIFQTDGMIGLFDARGYGGAPAEMKLSMPGHVNEVLKSMNRPNIDASQYQAFEQYYQKINRYNPAGFMKPELVELLQGKIHALAEHYRLEQLPPREAIDLYYTANRLPNWAGYLNRHDGYSQSFLHVLNHDGLIEMAYALDPREREINRYHFEMIKGFDPWLVECPLAAAKWPEDLRKYAGKIKIGNEGIPVPEGIPLHGSWQLELNRSPELRMKLWDIVTSYDNSDVWHYYDRGTVEKAFLTREFSYMPLICAYGFLNVFFTCHSIEIPMRLKLPRTVKQPRVTASAMRADVGKTIYRTDGGGTAAPFRSWEEYAQSGLNKKAVMRVSYKAAEQMLVK